MSQGSRVTCELKTKKKYFNNPKVVLVTFESFVINIASENVWFPWNVILVVRGGSPKPNRQHEAGGRGRGQQKKTSWGGCGYFLKLHSYEQGKGFM